MTNEISVRNNGVPMSVPDHLVGDWLEGKVYIESKMLPAHIKTPEQYIVVKHKARELGLPPLAAAAKIYVIQGTPTVAPVLMLGMANRTKELEDMIVNRDAQNWRVSVTIKRKGRTAHTETFGREEAIAQGLMGKDNYKKQPLRMFLWRALSLNLSVTFPDVLMGLLTPEELGADVIPSDTDELAISEVRITETTPNKQAKAKVAEINAALSDLHNRDRAAMDVELQTLTYWEDQQGQHSITLERLDQLADEKPAWVDRIYEKIMPEIVDKIRIETEKTNGKEGPQKEEASAEGGTEAAQPGS